MHRIYKIAEENCNTAKEMVGNFRQLAANVLDPLKVKYPSLIINKAKSIPVDEGFKIAKNCGHAVILQFTDLTADKYPDIAYWIKNNLPVSQLRLQYYTTQVANKTKTTASIGVAFGSTTNIPMIATTFNGSVVTPYLAKYNG